MISSKKRLLRGIPIGNKWKCGKKEDTVGSC